MKGVVRMGLLMALTGACGGSQAPVPEAPLVDRLQGIDGTLSVVGFQRAEDWMEVVARQQGLAYDLQIPANMCAAVVALAPTGQSVGVAVTGRTGPSHQNAGWVVACVREATTLTFDVSSTPGNPLAIGSYVGESQEANARLHAHFGSSRVPQLGAPPAPSPAAAAPTPVPAPASAEGRPPPPAVVDRPGVGGTWARLVAADCEDVGPDLRAAARTRYQSALTALRAGDLATAARDMAGSYACFADGTTLFNLAGIRARQNMHDEARRLYRELLIRHPNVPETRRREVETALQRLNAPGTLRVRTRSGDRVYVNRVRVRVGRRGAQARVMSGTADVLLIDSRGRAWITQVDVDPNGTNEVDPRRRPEGT